MDIIDLFFKMVELVDDIKESIRKFRELDNVKRIRAISSILLISIGCFLLFVLVLS